MITQEYVKELLQYNENTGIFTWKVNNRSNKTINLIAGGDNGKGYITIGINKKVYLAHRLAWLYYYGTFPHGQIDHINGIRNDNRICNLRDVDNRKNQSNRLKHRNGKLVGCSYYRARKKWQAYINKNGKQIHLGYYSTEIEAHNVYNQALNDN